MRRRRIAGGQAMLAGGFAYPGKPDPVSGLSYLDTDNVYVQTYNQASMKWTSSSTPVGQSDDENLQGRTGVTATVLSTKPCGSVCGQVLVVRGARNATAYLYKPPAADGPGMRAGGEEGKSGSKMTAMVVGITAALIVIVGSAALLRSRRNSKQPK